jgi:ketosteroid isomerase-like protein
VPKVVYGHYVISCTPTSAVVTHRNEVTSTVGGKEQTSYSRSVHVLEKRGGRWQVVSNAGHPLNDSAILAYMERDWNDAFIRRDRGWFDRNYADDASFVQASGVLMNKADAIADATADKGLQSLELSEVAIRVDGNAAVVTGVNRARGRDTQGRSMDYRLRFTDTFVKRDGRWLVWASQATRIP